MFAQFRDSYKILSNNIQTIFMKQSDSILLWLSVTDCFYETVWQHFIRTSHFIVQSDRALLYATLYTENKSNFIFRVKTHTTTRRIHNWEAL